jgi:hypothetical protein
MNKNLEEQKEEFLAHHGIKGMRWGHRGKSENYSDQQVKRDAQIYGKRGTQRINRSITKGDQISVARGDEKTRRDKVMGRNKYVRQGGKMAGAVGGAAVGYLAVKGLSALVESDLGRAAVLKVMGSGTRNSFMASTLAYHQIREGINAYAESPLIQGMVAVGAAKIGHMLAGDIAVNVNMRAHGYDPNRK